MTLLFALLSIGIGIALLFRGYPLAKVLIPLMGFLVGVSLGGAVYSDLADTPFLATLAGVAVALVAGAVFAFLAYAYYYLAVVILAAGIGYWLGSGFILLFGLDPGILSATLGIALGTIVAVSAIVTNAPKYTLMVLTAIAGAVATAGGFMLLFNVVPLEVYSYTTASFVVRNSLFWSLATIALAAVGIASQVMSTASDYEFQEWGVGHKGDMESDLGDGGQHHDVPPTTSTHMPAH